MVNKSMGIVKAVITHVCGFDVVNGSANVKRLKIKCANDVAVMLVRLCHT